MRSSILRIALGVAACALVASPAHAQRDGRTRESIYERGFDVSPGDRLVVEVGDMDVRVQTGGSAADVEVVASARDHAWAAERFEDMRFTASVSGGVLRVATDERRNSTDWREWERRGGVSFEVIITIPARFDLDLHTGDGDVLVSDVQGNVEVNTGDGDVVLASITGRDVSLSTGDGDVRAETIDAATITLHTGDGDLVVENASGAITARTGDGDVTIGVARFDGLSVRTGDGDIEVRADPTIRANVEVDGEDLVLDRAFRLTGSIRHDHLSGTLNGGGPALDIRTGDGSVRITGR